VKADLQIPMQRHANKKILAMVSDLFFTVKITEAARRTGMQVEFVKEEEDLLEKAHSKPALIIMDLNYAGAHPLKLIAKLKGDPDLKQISLLAYVSHVQGDLKQKAHETGCDMVMAKSAFSQNLSQILKRYAGTM
jgi:CheY-like chemotaxis protein